MIWILIVAVLPTMAFHESLGTEIDEGNSAFGNDVIEVFNDCKCVPAKRCDDNNYVLSYDLTYMQPRFKKPVSRIECRSNSSEKYYCCKTGLNTRILEDIKCGTGRTGISPRILTSDPSPYKNEFPWIAAIFKKAPDGTFKFRGGGSLIHPKVVLTVNHFLHKVRASDVMVVVNGKLKLPLDEEEKTGVSEIVRHPRYEHTGRLYYDAALLILEQAYPIDASSNINTLCLPPSGVSLENTHCLVAGWGEGEDREKLRKVEVPFVSHSRCEVLLKNTRLGLGFYLHESFMCAGGEKERDACVGDGGGPLMCPMPSKDDQYFQAGIVSWGVGCGSKNVPGVYTDVGKITRWIKSEMSDRNFDI